MESPISASIDNQLPAAKGFRKVNSSFKIDALNTSFKEMARDQLSSVSTQSSFSTSFKSASDLLNDSKMTISAISSNENLLQSADMVTFDFSALNYEDLAPLEELEDDTSSVSSFDEDEFLDKESNRNHRKEQLTQLAAMRSREAESILSLESRNNWKLENEKSSWVIHSKAERGQYWIRNSIKVDTSLEKAKGLISKMDKRKESNRRILKRKVLEQVSKDCSIIYERSSQSQVGPTDSLIVQLQKQTNSQFKMTELSVEDRRCPSFAGIKREHMELRFWNVVPAESNDSIELILIQCFKLKSKENLAHQADDFKAQNYTFIKSLGKLVEN